MKNDADKAADRLKEFSNSMDSLYFYCKKCGRVLTPFESLAGDLCATHAREKWQQEKQNTKSERNENNGFPL